MNRLHDSPAEAGADNPIKANPETKAEPCRKMKAKPGGQMKAKPGGQMKANPCRQKRPCVYILRCRDGSLYTGWTNDFKKRLEAHSSGKGAKYTRGRLPVTPVYLEFLPDKIAAARREAAIKKLPLKKKQQLIISSSNQLHDIFPDK